MDNAKPTSSKVYFIAMSAFWFIFGMITLFAPALMNMFQTDTGVNAVTVYSDHVWRHDGYDILSISVLFFALSRETATRNMLKAGATVALLVTIAIASSLLSTDYWNKLFIVPGVCCLAFCIWGFMLASKIKQ
jgi:hypothetical protein